jgi:hypothetical protein
VTRTAISQDDRDEQLVRVLNNDTTAAGGWLRPREANATTSPPLRVTAHICRSALARIGQYAL